MTTTMAQLKTLWLKKPTLLTKLKGYYSPLASANKGVVVPGLNYLCYNQVCIKKSKSGIFIPAVLPIHL